jgi:outer membrane protein OmpA-like peptidoglycan-associated protein
MPRMEKRTYYRNTFLIYLALFARNISISTVFIAFCFTLTAQANNKLTTDHPLISRFEGAERFHHHFYDYIATEIPVGEINDTKSNDNILHVEGRASFITYTLPKSTSQLAFFKVIQHQIAQSKFSVVFECQHNDNINNCGKKMHALSKSNRVRNGFQFSCGSDEEFYLLTAKIARADNKNTYLYLCSEDGKVNQTIVEEKNIDYNQMTMSTDNYHPDEQLLSGLKPQTGRDKEGAKDHALISRYPGSIIERNGVSDFIQVSLPIKPLKYNEKTDSSYSLPISGKVTFINYKQQQGLSQFQLLKNYQQVFEKNNVEILFQCRGDDECGSTLLSKVDHGDLLAEHSGKPNFDARCGSSNAAIISAKKQLSPTRNAYFLYCFNDSPWLTVSQYIIEEKAVETDLVTMSVDAMSSEIAAKGKVAIYGVLFASNSDEIEGESSDMLKKIATLLTNQPALSLYVVGHTDSQGDEHYNQVLAEKRAQSVIDALHKDYGIAIKRLQARGVGELVPVSSNSANEGRKLNRRVELVEI